MLDHYDPYDDDNCDFVNFLSELVKRDELSGAALGVARQVIGKGFDSLSEQQVYVLEEYVIKKFAVQYCRRGSCVIPWSEMIDALDNGGYCSWCEHTRQKIMNE